MVATHDDFGLVINQRTLKSPIAIASMAGIVDAPYVLSRAAHIGMGFIGGYSIDSKTIAASRQMAAEGRSEFLLDNPIEELDRQIKLMNGSDVVLGINLRGSSPTAFHQVADSFGHSVIYEIDAHCHQLPMVEAGAGEYYLEHPDSLGSVVHELKRADVTVSVKIRAGVSASDPLLAKKIWKAGADIIHIDLMDYGNSRLKQIRNACPVMLIANNSINTFDRMMEMFSHGADLVSLARRSDRETLAGLDAAITRYADDYGWYNAPKQLCRGGDVRSLTFCCMPIKKCPLTLQLKTAGLNRDEYIALKTSAVKGTPLENGQFTCFGSMTWCCKATSPCMLRDATLEREGLSKQDYMKLKRHLSEKIVHYVFDELNHDDED